MQQMLQAEKSADYATSRDEGKKRALESPVRPENPAFGEAVRNLLAERGLTQAQASYKTRVDRFTIGQMRAGHVPRMERVIDFARGFGLDVNEWLVLAGYEPIEPAETGYEILVRGVAELRQRRGEPILISWDRERVEALTPAEARALLADLEAELAAG